MRLSDYIDAHGMTQQQFAEIVGCEQPTIARFCSGRTPSPRLMKKILNATNGAVTPNDFFDLTPEREAA